MEAKGRIAPRESPRSIQDAVRGIQRDTRPDLDRQMLTEAVNRHFSTGSYSDLEDIARIRGRLFGTAREE